jgi:hypothetical protein
MMLPDVDSSISYFTLKTRSGCEAERDIMIHVEQTIKMTDKILFVIRFYRDHAIGTFHVQRGGLSTQRGSCNLRMSFNEKMCPRN